MPRKSLPRRNLQFRAVEDGSDYNPPHKGNLDWNGEIAPGPLEIGFDYCFLIPATGDRVPCLYVEDYRVVNLDPEDPIEVSYKLQFDACVGAILGALDRLSLAENTLVILSSDNGPVVDDRYRDQAVERLGNHRPSRPWRGGKYSAFEGGTRVPFIVRWPQHVKPSTSQALIGQIDLLASLGRLTGQAISAPDAPDSVDVLPALLGDSMSGHQDLVEQAGRLSLRRGPWKYIVPNKRPRFNEATGTEMGNEPAPQLYNLADDPGEQSNAAGGAHEIRARQAHSRKTASKG